ncbi:hypothetical protein [Sphingobacterium faecium]|uniref:hypothetical protein n=1 Tax=Sphingobacterium faecium TaxID=34087 RepID=UPI0032091EE2
MATNLLKKYNGFLDLTHLNEASRTISLRGVFDRDIANNTAFVFRQKIIRPLKKEGEVDMDTLFGHLTRKTEDMINPSGETVKSRNIFDIDRSKRLHWIWHHIQENVPTVLIFSSQERKDGKDVIRTYIFDIDEHYVIVLQPQRSTFDYYLLSAYYLNEEWARRNMKKKWKRRISTLY